MNFLKDNSWIYFILIIGLIVIAAGIVTAPKANFAPASNFSLTPMPTKTAKEAKEQEITAWTVYNNSAFNFSLNVPSGWQSQDYSSQTGGGALIAFSPNALPCKTCTYFHDGYFSIKIYNQKTSPEEYGDFVMRKNYVGKKSGYGKIIMAGKEGVFFDNTIAVENQGWVYELTLDKDQGNAKVEEATAFQKIFSSFQFTGLVFN